MPSSATTFGQMGRDADRKLRNDNDIKIIVVGQNSQTGIGKTTLAIQLCRAIDRNGWSASEKAFIDVHDYIDAHMNEPAGSCLLMDEIEAGADNRRAMSHENVELSQAWATMRARNIATVTTSPSVNMVDSRMMELADYWVLVKERGLAQPFKINVNDFNGRISRKPLPGEEHITFGDLADNDPDKEYLDAIKDEMLRDEGMERIPQSEHKQEVKKARKEGRQEKRNEAIRELYEKTDMSTNDLSDYGWVGVSQQQVANITNDG